MFFTSPLLAYAVLADPFPLLFRKNAKKSRQLP